MPILIAIIASYVAGLFLRGFFFAGIAMQALYLFHRGFTAGRLPILGVYDTIFFFSFSIALFGAAFSPFIKQKKQFLRWTALVSIIFMVPTLFLQPHFGPLPPVLNTFWFEIHVILSFFSYALFTLGGITGIFILLYKEPEIERVQYRSIFIGYTLFSISMIAGGIWAFYAWGTYWLWTPKEIWTSVLWLYYSLYLHLRFHKNFTGTRASLVGTFGTVVMLFTYLGVSLLMKSSHSF